MENLGLEIISQVYLKDWLKDFLKLKNVKSALFVKKAGPSNKTVLKITPKDSTDLKTIEYVLNNPPSIDSDDEFQFIYSDLRTKGYGK